MKLEKLKRIRESKKITQKQMSEILKVSEETYKSYELGRREMKVQMIKQIAELFEITTDELI